MSTHKAHTVNVTYKFHYAQVVDKFGDTWTRTKNSNGNWVWALGDYEEEAPIYGAQQTGTLPTSLEPYSLELITWNGEVGRYGNRQLLVEAIEEMDENGYVARIRAIKQTDLGAGTSSDPINPDYYNTSTASAPYIIAIEGIDGAGKNTTTKQLAQLLNATTITFPQYGKTQAAHQITQHLKNPTLNPWHAAQLFAQDRAQTPLPTTGTIIIDRYVASNAAYLKAQTGDPRALQAIEDLEFNTLKLPKPHLHILIDTPVDTAMERTKQRANTNGDEPDTNETDRALQHKVRETYLNMAETSWVSPWIVITPQTTKD